MAKRIATSELNHDNWNQEEKSEEAGSFKKAAPEVMQQRIIKAAKRRAGHISEEVTKSPFSGFGGFIKPSSDQTKLFSFTSNVKTNNSSDLNMKEDLIKPSNTDSSNGNFKLPTGTAFNKDNSAVLSTSTVENSKLLSSHTNMVEKSNLKSNPTSSVENLKLPTSSANTNKMLKTTSSPNNTGSFKFPVTPANSSGSFKIPSSVAGSAENFKFSSNSENLKFPTFLAASPINLKSPQLPEKIVSSPKKLANFISSQDKQSSTDSVSTSLDRNPPNKRRKSDQYYLMLQGLNDSVSCWVKQHVDINPHCILTPVFDDYSKHLEELEQKYGNIHDSKKEFSEERKDDDISSSTSWLSNSKSPFGNLANAQLPVSPASMSGFTLQGSESTKPNSSIFGSHLQNNGSNKPQLDSSIFRSSPQNKVSSKQDQTFGGTLNSGKLSFSFPGVTANSPQCNGRAESKSEESVVNDEDEPPKPSHTPVVEEGAIYSKRCKMFVKKGGPYQELGVGTLFLKPVSGGDKTQLIVRADTSLGNVLLNTLLSSSLPVQRMGKNNVMIVCLPTPDATPPPVPVLLRVKTGEEADELLDKLNQHRK
uniref:RanBD1 domain-containing protein n=1 Tax=Timema bartmani TaxID=61472 RepID=A0A7R9HYB8_9NEOP|nr:unnamed protein product [Timema bartmani]